jgi:hypothetical protein
MVLETRELKATTVEQAKAEADGQAWRWKPIPAPHALEIIDAQWVVMAHRQYRQNIHTPWSTA